MKKLQNKHLRTKLTHQQLDTNSWMHLKDIV